jgi:hypothetical protein
MTDPEPLPAGTPSALEAAAQPPPPRPRHHVMAAGTGVYEYTGSPSVLLLTLASQNLLAHARSLAAKTEGEFHQMAVVFAHAACELHTEWAINQLLDARPDKTLVDLVLPAERDVMSLDNQRIRRVYAALTGDNPTESEWWKDWLDSRQDRHDVAHRGEQMTRAKADKAIALADRYIQHLTEKAPKDGLIHRWIWHRLGGAM